MRRYTLWLWIAVVVMLLNATIHSLTLFISPAPENPTEQQLMQLMQTYRPNLGPFFHPTTGNLVTALSSCFSLLCLLGALTNAYLLKKKADAGLMKGFVGINLLVFGICFGVMLVFTFLPPIILSGLIALFLLIAFITTPRPATVEGHLPIVSAAQN